VQHMNAMILTVLTAMMLTSPSLDDTSPTAIRGGHAANAPLIVHHGGEFPNDLRITRRGRIGVILARVDDALSVHLGLDPDHVVMIESVVPDAAADLAGVQAYDIITHIDGQSPVTRELLRESVLKRAPGEVIEVTVLRAGETMDISIEVQAEPMDDRFTATFMSGWSPDRSIMLREHNTDELARELQILLRQSERLRDEEMLRQIRERVQQHVAQRRRTYETSDVIVELHKDDDEEMRMFFRQRPRTGGVGGGSGRPLAPPTPGEGIGRRGGGGGGAGGVGSTWGGGFGGTAPAAPTRPLVQVEPLQQRMDAIDARMERIERMLEMLVERDRN